MSSTDENIWLAIILDLLKGKLNLFTQIYDEMKNLFHVLNVIFGFPTTVYSHISNAEARKGVIIK